MNLWIFFSGLWISISLPLSASAITADGHKMMISGPSAYAVEVGETVTRMGGNAVDVAVSIGFALSVTTPYYASLGGGGFALVKMGNDNPIALDFRETAPKSTSPTFYTEDSKRSSRQGGAAIGVPGNVMGLYELHKKYGKLPWKKLLESSIRLANKGFKVSGEWVEKTESQKKRFNSSGLSAFYKKSGKDYLPGETLVQRDLAKALTKIQESGAKGFYTGEVAKDLVESVKAQGGVLTLDDLKDYKVRWLKPLETSYNGYQVHLMPPPSSGGVVIAQSLKLVEKLGLSKFELLSSEELHLLGEILARSYRGRAGLADPDFHDNPIEELLDEKSINGLAKSIHIKKATALALPKEIEMNHKESSETTHFTVMDKDGNTVSLTYTLNGNYGSGVVSDKFKIALNNEMDDFTTKPGEPNMFGLVQGMANKVEAGKRPLSSMSPTLVTKDGETVLALGAPGGPRIISSVFQVLYRVLGQNLDLDLAIQTPRVHHQFLPNVLYIDRQRFSPEVVNLLKKKGHKVEEAWMAKVYAIQKDSNGILRAAYDSRGEGAAGGL